MPHMAHSYKVRHMAHSCTHSTCNCRYAKRYDEGYDAVATAIRAKPSFAHLRKNVKYYKGLVDHYDATLEALPTEQHDEL